jgi:hypothetical protein
VRQGSTPFHLVLDLIAKRCRSNRVLRVHLKKKKKKKKNYFQIVENKCILPIDSVTFQ